MPWDQINVCMAQVVNTESFSYTLDIRSDYDTYYDNLVAKDFGQLQKLTAMVEQRGDSRLTR